MQKGPDCMGETCLSRVKGRAPPHHLCVGGDGLWAGMSCLKADTENLSCGKRSATFCTNHVLRDTFPIYMKFCLTCRKSTGFLSRSHVTFSSGGSYEKSAGTSYYYKLFKKSIGYALNDSSLAKRTFYDLHQPNPPHIPCIELQYIHDLREGGTRILTFKIILGTSWSAGPMVTLNLEIRASCHLPVGITTPSGQLEVLSRDSKQSRSQLDQQQMHRPCALVSECSFQWALSHTQC